MLDFTDDDRLTLERFRLARFQHCLPPLPACMLHLDQDYVLHIHCHCPGVLEGLLEVIAELEAHALIILGCLRVMIWNDGNMVFRSANDLDLNSDPIVFVRESDMATATLVSPVDTILKEEAQKAITPVLDEMIDQELNGYLNSDDFQGVIRERVQERLRSWLKPANVNSNGSAPTAEMPTETTETATATEAGEFKVASNYFTTLFHALMNRAGSAKDALTLLTQIRRSNKKGQETIDWIVSHYPEDKRSGARTGLLKTSTLDRVQQRLQREMKSAEKKAKTA